MSTFLAAITNSANFGAGGSVGTPITVIQVSSIDAITLAGADGVFIPWWADGESSSSAAALSAFFKAGGDLMLLNDNTGHDFIGETLGLPTSGSDGTLSNGASPLFAGPFGAATNVAQGGNTGAFDAGALAAINGSVGGLNASGQITSALWDDAQYVAGSGRMVMLGDVDMVSNAYGLTDYTALNGNARFALNSVAYLVGGKTGAVPEPASWGMMILGFGLIGAAMRRRTRMTVSYG